MSRNLHLLAGSAVALALAAPAAAHAAHPASGTFSNTSQTDGFHLVSSGHTIKTLSLYCAKSAYHEAENSYEVPRAIHVRDDGTFSYRGRAERYGKQGQWLGYFKVRVSGRFVSPTRVKIKRVLSGCDTQTASATRQS
jgi:hypothetical protein